jgi:beta-lactamase regulating signal transducer with metallopeptidase domain
MLSAADLRLIQLPATQTASVTEPSVNDLKAVPTLPQPKMAIWPILMLGAWVVGAIWQFNHLIKAWLGVRRLSSSKFSSNARRHLDLTRLEDHPQFRIHRPWWLRLSKSELPPSAMTWGALQPVVILPRGASEWTSERLEAVMLHELAHVRRWDCATQMLSAVVCALYWFNPIVWLGARAMRSEAESAADDLVLQSGWKPSDYASELLQVAAEIGHRRQPFAKFGVSVMNQPKIESRIQAILDPARHRRGVTAIEALCLTFVGLVVMVPAAMLKPAAQSTKPNTGTNKPARQVVVKKLDTAAQLRREVAELKAQLRMQVRQRAEMERQKEALHRQMATLQMQRAMLDKDSQRMLNEQFKSVWKQSSDLVKQADKLKEQQKAQEDLIRQQADLHDQKVRILKLKSADDEAAIRTEVKEALTAKSDALQISSEDARREDTKIRALGQKEREQVLRLYTQDLMRDAQALDQQRRSSDLTMTVQSLDVNRTDPMIRYDLKATLDKLQRGDKTIPLYRPDTKDLQAAEDLYKLAEKHYATIQEQYQEAKRQADAGIVSRQEFLQKKSEMELWQMYMELVKKLANPSDAVK